MFGDFKFGLSKIKVHSADGTTLHVAVPGFTKDQIQVNVAGPMISVTAEIPRENDKDRYAFNKITSDGRLRSIRYDYYFDRPLRQLEVSAVLENGLLTLEVEATKNTLLFNVPIQTI